MVLWIIRTVQTDRFEVSWCLWIVLTNKLKICFHNIHVVNYCSFTARYVFVFHILCPNVLYMGFVFSCLTCPSPRCPLYVLIAENKVTSVQCVKRALCPWPSQRKWDLCSFSLLWKKLKLGTSFQTNIHRVVQETSTSNSISMRWQNLLQILKYPPAGVVGSI